MTTENRPEENTTGERKKPAFEVKVGAVRATVWSNPVKDGVRFNTTFSRSYKDGDTWKSTPSFGERDLMDVVRAAVEAEAWIRSQTPEKAS